MIQNNFKQFSYKKLIFQILLLGFFGSIVGCSSIQPLNGLIYADIQGPVSVTSNPRGPNHGEACAHSYFGLVATGDASITAAARAGGISTISYVEQHSSNILVYATYCTEVWGYPPKSTTR